MSTLQLILSIIHCFHSHLERLVNAYLGHKSGEDEESEGYFERSGVFHSEFTHQTKLHTILEKKG